MTVRALCFATLCFLRLTPSIAQTCVDEDGNTYGFVQIGTQYWMSENLRTTTFQNGDLIPNYTSNWTSANSPAWCWQQDDSMYDTILGKLYNHYAVADSRNICPAGWHVPTDGEFAQLVNEIGSDPGGKLKATGTIESNTGWWNAPNTGATDDYGFSALGGGFRDGASGVFQQVGIFGHFHVLTSNPAETVLYWFTYNNTSALNTNYGDFQMGGACRCVSYVVDWADDDGDGIPASQDPCPLLAFLAPGMPCDDGDLYTGADSVNTDCLCIGLPDADADGTPDINDLCPGGPEPGAACDDGSPFTALDAITATCQCAGLPDSDGDGTPNIDDICAGSPEPGSSCDDGDPNTALDVVAPDCQCEGQPDADGDGTPDADDVCPAGPEPGSSCNDGDPSTALDTVTGNCQCIGQPDTDQDGTPDASDPCPLQAGYVPGGPCDDGDPFTANDVVSAFGINCTCEGVPDGDGDGVPDTDDVCPDGPDPGQSCDDGSSLTADDTVNGSCDCVGLPDNDEDGVPDISDPCPVQAGLIPGEPCDDGNPNTENDVVLTSGLNCFCQGEFSTSLTSATSSSFRIVPNPSSGFITITVPTEASNAVVVIHDAYGRILRSLSLVSNTQVLDLTHLAKGLYTISVQSQNGIATQRIVLE